MPLEKTEHGAIPSLTPMPSPQGPAGTVKEPEFPDELSGYRYEMLRHQRALVKSGTHKVIVNGLVQEYTFKIEGPEID